MTIQHSTRLTMGSIRTSNIAAVSRTRAGSIDASTLISGNVAVGTTTFTDSSVNNFTVTTFGNTVASNAQTKFGNTILFDGNLDYLRMNANSAFAVSTINTTTEAWIYITTAKDSAVWSLNTTGTQDGYAADRLVIRTDGSAVWLKNSGSTSWINTGNVASAGTFVANTWYHVACVRNGSDFSVYKDGNRTGGYTSSSSVFDQNGFNYVACTFGGSIPRAVRDFFAGHITDFRFTRGAIYTANFTPPTSALTNVAAVTTTVTNAVYGMRQQY